MTPEETKKLKPGERVLLNIEGVGYIDATVVAVGPRGYQVHVKTSQGFFISNEQIIKP